MATTEPSANTKRAIWSKLKDDSRRNSALILKLSERRAHDPRLKLSPLGTVVGNNVRIINDHAFTSKSGGSTTRSVNADTGIDEFHRCFGALPFPKLLKEFTQLSTSDAKEAFCNVRVLPEFAQFQVRAGRGRRYRPPAYFWMNKLTWPLGSVFVGGGTRALARQRAQRSHLIF